MIDIQSLFIVIRLIIIDSVIQVPVMIQMIKPSVFCCWSGLFLGHVENGQDAHFSDSRNGNVYRDPCIKINLTNSKRQRARLCDLSRHLIPFSRSFKLNFGQILKDSYETRNVYNFSTVMDFCLLCDPKFCGNLSMHRIRSLFRGNLLRHNSHYPAKHCLSFRNGI